MLHIGAVVQKGKDGINPTEGKRLWAADPSVFKPGGLGGYYTAPFNFPDDYHVIGLLWDTDDTLTYYCDGVELMKGTYKWKIWDGTDAPYAHILLNLDIGGKWAGRYGIDDSAFPQAMCIDYVRVYQKKGQTLMGQGLVGHDLYKPPAP
jgi:beta-glucanase (GH16 family)